MSRTSMSRAALVIACFVAGCGGDPGRVERPNAGPAPSSAPAASASAPTAAATPKIPPQDAAGIVRTVVAATSVTAREDRAAILATGCGEISSCAGVCAKELATAGSPKTSRAERERAVAGCFPELSSTLTAGDRIEHHVVAYAQEILSANVLDAKNADVLRAALSKVHQPALVIDGRGVSLDSDARPLVPLPADPSAGADAAYKRAGAKDRYLVPVGEALKKEVAAGRLPHELRILVDDKAAYRLFVEALATAEESGLSAFEVCEGSCSRRRFEFSAARPVATTPGAHPMNLLVIVGSEGISIKASGGNVAPGCNSVGEGVTIPRAGGTNDVAAFARCVTKVRSADPAFESEDSATIRAATTTAIHDVVDVALALAGPSKPLFPRLAFVSP